MSVLTAEDPSPVRIVNPGGPSPFLLIGDHAGNRVPAQLGTLGLGEAERVRHIAWDIGIAALGEALATRLGAAFVAQIYSRLVVDCNRAPGAPDAIAPVSDGTLVPGNAELPAAERDARFAEIHEPYHHAIAAEIARRDAADAQTVLVALHSFTPRMGSVSRPWHAGVLRGGGDVRFALACLDALRARGDLVVGDNEPYHMDQIDYTVPRHAFPRRRPYLELEVRQDLIADPAGAERWADILAQVLPRALAAAS